MDWYIGNEWQLERKGLRKQVLDIDFKKLEKPHQVSKVIIKVDEVRRLDKHASKYLGLEKMGEEQHLKMGTALTPVDCYVELLIQQMITGERARCFIRACKQTKGEEITFIINLIQIVESKEIHKLDMQEMYTLALCYKENGVNMFKQYPVFAHDYFARAAKCLLSYRPFDDLTVEEYGVACHDMQGLFIQIQTNLAACLLAQKRYEDVIYQTDFVATMTEPSEKSAYRRAVALLQIKEFEAAQNIIGKVANHQEKKEFVKLLQIIEEDSKISHDQYKNVVKRMFR